MRMGIEEITEIAMGYVRKAGYSWVSVNKVISDESNYEWKVTLNVGVLANIFKIVRIDDRDGKIIGFE